MGLPTKVEKLKALENDFSTTVAVALWKKAAQLVNYLEQSYPIGYVLFVHGTQSNLPHLPNSKYWQEIDGTTISDINSPMNGVALADWRGKFFRHAKTGETIFSTGGANTLNLQHSHGGVTGVTNPRYANLMNDGSTNGDLAEHNHSISPDLSNPVTTVPLYIMLRTYVRYK